MNPRTECKHYDGCNSMLCPMLSDEENKKIIWYPDEDICKLRKNMPVWMKQQIKIAKKAQEETHWFYFTLDMLKRQFRVTKKVKGLDPNKEEEPQMNAWLNNNNGTGRRTICEAEREKRRQIMAKARAAKKRNIQVKATQSFN